jgi:hypothetical protein
LSLIKEARGRTQSAMSTASREIEGMILRDLLAFKE